MHKQNFCFVALFIYAFITPKFISILANYISKPSLFLDKFRTLNLKKDLDNDEIIIFKKRNGVHNTILIKWG